MLVPHIYVQLLYPGWQRADRASGWVLSNHRASGWVLSNHCCPTALRPSLQPVGEKSFPEQWPMSPLTRARSSGHGEMGSKWRQLALREGPGECACTGVRQDTSESEKISQSKDRYFRRDRLRINWEYDLTWERVMPDLFSFMFLLFWASPSGNTNLQGISKRWKTWCLMLRVNTLPSWAPTPHTGKPSPRGADSPLGPLSQEDSGP